MPKRNEKKQNLYLPVIVLAKKNDLFGGKLINLYLSENVFTLNP